MCDEKDKPEFTRAELANMLDPALRPKHDGPLTHEETMEIARAVMRKNRNVLAALAVEDEKPPLH